MMHIELKSVVTANADHTLYNDDNDNSIINVNFFPSNATIFNMNIHVQPFNIN